MKYLLCLRDFIVFRIYIYGEIFEWIFIFVFNNVGFKNELYKDLYERIIFVGVIVRLIWLFFLFIWKFGVLELIGVMVLVMMFFVGVRYF